MRPATREERADVEGSLDAIQGGLAARMRGDRDWAVFERDGRRIVALASPALLRMPPDLLEGAEGGLPLAALEDGLGLDLQGAVVFARETKRQTVRANEKGTRMFLYGRDLLGTSILEYDGRLRRGDHCVVVDPRGEGIGIGQVVGSFKGPGSAVRAVHDLGSYLRSQ